VGVLGAQLAPVEGAGGVGKPGERKGGHVSVMVSELNQEAEAAS
jgi:hypothetical protein